MVTQPQSQTRLAFGPFEVNAAAEELLKGGARIRLPGQPFQILLLLLAHPGDVVTREQLRDQIWSEGTFVDFEHGLNAAMNKLRRILGDSADNPRYIETIAGRGYRFIGTVEHRSFTPSLISTPSQPRDETPAARRRFYPAAGAWTWAAIATCFGIWGATRLLKKPPATLAPVLQFVISPPPGTFFSPPISRQSFAISPDGKRLAFTASGLDGSKVWIRDLAAGSSRPVAGTDGAWTVFWSPDSRSIFYSAKQTIKQANLETGFSRSFATLPMMTVSGTWRSNDDLLLYLGPAASYEISTKTGGTQKLPGSGMRWAQFLPGTDRFLHVVYDSAIGHYRAYASNFTSHESVPLMETDSRVQYAPPRQPSEPGYLLFIRGGSLLAQPFDATHLRLMGEPFALAQNVIYYRPTASACFSVSTNGILVYQSGFPLSELRWYDRAGHVVRTTNTAPFSGTVRISPDGHHVAADVWSSDSGVRNIWVFDENGRESRRLTYPPAAYRRPVWSPDGRRIAFGFSHSATPLLASMNTDDSGKIQQFLNDDAVKQMPANQIQIPTDWSRDGRYIAYDTSLGEEEREVWLLDVTSNKIVPLLQNGSSQWGAAFSPDGRQIAFISDESGRPEIYVQTFEPSPTPHLVGDRKQLSRNGAWLVRWRPDGHELFFVGIDSSLYAAPVGRSSAIGEPKTLFQIPGNPQYGTPTDLQFDVEPGGQSFVITTAASVSSPDFTVIQNWQDKFHH